MNREQLGPTIFALLLLSFTVAHNQRWLSAIMISVLRSYCHTIEEAPK